MAGGGKGGSQTTTVRLPESLERAAEQNLALADQVGRMPFIPYQGPTVAGLTEPQIASMAGTRSAASAFGLDPGAVPTLGGNQMVSGNGGIGLSPYAQYQASVNAIPADQRAMIESFLTGVNPQQGGAGKGGTQQPQDTYRPFGQVQGRLNDMLGTRLRGDY